MKLPINNSLPRSTYDFLVSYGAVIILSYLIFSWVSILLPSLFWHWWLGIKKGMWPIKNWVMRCWHGYLICIWSSWCHCHPTISCFIKIQIGLSFPVPVYRGCPGNRGH